MLLEANDEWQTQNRYMQTEAMAEFAPTLLDAKTSKLPPPPPDQWPALLHTNFHHVYGRYLINWQGFSI